MKLVRGLFVVAVLVFAWLSLRGRWDEIGDALSGTSPAGVLGALALVLGGLLVTGRLWLRLMSWLDAPLPYADGQAIFFLGQLGKYIPGSVWSIGAQADLARKHDVPPRATIAAGLLFLGYHVDTAVLVGASAILLGDLDPSWPTWVTVLALVVAVVGVAPRVVRYAGRTVARRDVTLTWLRTLETLGLMALTWLAYALALVLLVPDRPWSDVMAFGGAFAAAYAVGVLVVLAPAGVGARETVFVVLLTPLLGVAPATALALLARVVHTVADAALALGAWVVVRGRERDPGRRRDISPRRVASAPPRP